MSLDSDFLLAGLAFVGVCAVVAAFYLQRRLSAAEAARALLDERLTQAALAQEGLSAQLESVIAVDDTMPPSIAVTSRPWRVPSRRIAT
ncbi:hypothetical protein SSTU70S_05459 [Stutzerimonas stutzeri]